MNGVPTEAELEAAPILEGWVLESPSDSRPWLYGWFFGHPEIDDGDHGHTAPVLDMDRGSPARWARTESRLYRLGLSYPPAEREIRYWAQKLRRRRHLPLGDAPGGGNDIDAMIAFIREEKPFREQKLTRMEHAYREEQEQMAAGR
ncbi:hypothetical protein SAMN05216228_104026 [Rhizobium tibeticum]|uniref:Uncharacterized protein n=2 Tax=Rhizobium tibeticum TaxID=501024 RepID=A0A1H8V959_9HYPH|nr:hypothetical protein RTCCBAU85039_5927 [Rhizobium tibeticum]SEP11871.1 hypothetical protein SAMN05216228_104026 [Rhizobium tibeticum]